MKLSELLDNISDPPEDQLDYEVRVLHTGETKAEDFDKTIDEVRFEHNDRQVILELE